MRHSDQPDAHEWLFDSCFNPEVTSRLYLKFSKSIAPKLVKVALLA